MIFGYESSLMFLEPAALKKQQEDGQSSDWGFGGCAPVQPVLHVACGDMQNKQDIFPDFTKSGMTYNQKSGEHRRCEHAIVIGIKYTLLLFVRFWVRPLFIKIETRRALF